MKQTTDILIVGGGLNGTALALALAAGGFNIALAETLPAKRQSSHDFDGRAYALALASQKMLVALGIWPEISEHAQPILDIYASDGRPGEGAAPWFLHFDHREIEEGPMGFMVEDRYLRRALLDRVSAVGNIRRINKSAVAQMVATDGVDVAFADGATFAAGLLVGCDGRKSKTAQRAGINRTEWGYGQTALVAAIAHEKPHDGVAHQFFTPSGPLGILPLPGRRCSIVWAETDARAAKINALADREYLAELRPAFGDFLGKIELAGDRFAYPLGLSVANRFVADRVALVGDAAHGIHPLAGQGLNLGLRDVAALAEVLIEAKRRGEDVTSPLVLARYEQWRRFDTTAMAMATDGINRLFSNDNPVLRAGRDIGLGVVNALPVLRRGLMRQAAGLGGELPKLMRGTQI